MFRGGFIRRAVRCALLSSAARQIGCDQKFCGAIHWRDHLMHHMLTVSKDHDAGLREYFSQGAKDAAQVLLAMHQLGHSSDCSILEFASGYGRVTRHLNLPRLTACDIHRSAVSFLKRKLRAHAIRSNTDPHYFEPGERYDFIFVLSLFSHLPDALFGPWLTKLCSLLKPGGHLLFTTNGAAAVALIPRLSETDTSRDGIGFLPDTDQPDLKTAVYGTAVITPEYARYKINLAKGQVVSHRSGAWWKIQDEWVIARA